MAERITFAWWNTSLAPSGKSRGSEELRACAVYIISYLVFTLKVDFLALAEVSDEDFEYLQSIAAFEGMRFFSGVSSVGRSKFDICYIYNPSNILLYGNENITSVKGGATLKIGQRLLLVDVDTQTVFNVFCSHWPSRLWCEEHHANRHLLGVRLRDEVDKIINESTSPPHVILLGDYNDEPFAASISEQLMATRDMDLVRNKEHLLYNPYWGKLSQSVVEKRNCGSYFYKSGDITRWHTFDQIIYSHAFIRQDQWRLSEEGEHICNVPRILDWIFDPKSEIDHVPVYGIIERVS